MKRIKARFKNTPEPVRQMFQRHHCLLTVSVGQATHEDQRFLATMELIKKSFARCTVTLHDTLQRHTMALLRGHAVTAEACYAESKTLGDRWLERNQCFLGSAKGTINIVRWDEWLLDPDYTSHKDRVLATIKKHAQYRAAFDQTIDDYLARYEKRHASLKAYNPFVTRQLCFDYLVEECAVLCMWPKTGCAYEIYAGKHNVAMQETRDRFIAPCFPRLIQPLTVTFNHRSNLVPQNFSFPQERMVRQQELQ